MSEIDTEAAGAPKRQKLSYEVQRDENEMAIAGPSTEQPPPKIFKLNVDCFDEMFEYLSLKDLNSFALTCKAMHKVASEYFKRNYFASELDMTEYKVDIVSHGDIQLPTAFSQYVTKIRFIEQGLEALLYFALHPNEFAAINKIFINVASINQMTVDTFKSHLSKLEELQISDVTVEENSLDDMLKFCTNLKYLRLEFLSYETNGPAQFSWIHQKYPKLTRLELDVIPSMYDLNIFFQNNPSIQIFDTQAKEIQKYRNEIINLTVHLDVLNVNIIQDRVNVPFCEILNQQHEQKIYKQLGLFVHCGIANEVVFTDDFRAGLVSLRGLKHLRLDLIPGSYSGDLSSLPDLRNLNTLETIDFQIFGSWESNVIAKKFPNLERLAIGNAVVGTSLSCIRVLPKLKMLKLLWINDKSKNLKLITLNKEREKLLGAQKVTIYVPDDVFLHNKWKFGNGDTNLQMIEMKRLLSCTWNDRHFHY